MDIEAWDEDGRSIAERLTGYLAKLEPSTAVLMLGARAIIRRRFPTAIELVYDNYNFFVMGYCTSPRASDCIVSLAASAKGLALSFYNGAALADPMGLLLGEGKQNRFIRLAHAEQLLEAGVEQLLAAAAAQAKHPLLATGGGYTVLKSVSAKQRPRRKTIDPA